MKAYRRSHRKSRAGCLQCKGRRVKCDETKPSCRHCLRRESECTYPPPAAAAATATSPAPRQESNTGETARPPQLSTPPVLSQSPSRGILNGQCNVNDLKLLHFFTTCTYKTLSQIPERRSVWLHIIPQLAFLHDFLLHGLLALSALHLSRVQPNRKHNLSAAASRHHDKSLASFRSAMSKITPQNCDACFSFSTLLVIYAWASSDGTGDLFFSDFSGRPGDDGTVEWVRLLRGVNSLLGIYYFEIRQGPLGKLIHLWDDDAKPCPETKPEDTARFTALEQLWNKTPMTISVAEADALRETLEILKETYSYMSLPVPDSGVDPGGATLSWPIRVPEIYIQMVNRRQPEALILLAHYCLLLNKMEKVWWMRGMSRHLLQTIHKTIGKEWESWITWPLQDLVLSEFKNENQSDGIKYGLPSRSDNTPV